MLSIEEYIARRKKEDRLNEFDIEARSQNLKICVDYVFEYFNNYLNTTEAEEKTVLHSEKLNKYRKQLQDYEPEVREWAVGIYDEYGKQIHRYIGNILREYELFFLYNTDSEFRKVGDTDLTYYLREQIPIQNLFVFEDNLVDLNED